MAHLLDDADEWSSLDDVARDLRKYLNISNLKPLLREKRLLTDDEFEQVEISPANPTSQAIDKFISILKTKHPNHSEKLLEVIKLSLDQEDYHMGHDFLARRLEAAILERKAAGRERAVNVAALQEAVGVMGIRGHHRIGAKDSGVVLVGSSTDSSQETSSPRSTTSYLPYSGGGGGGVGGGVGGGGGGGGGGGYSRPVQLVNLRSAPFSDLDEDQRIKVKHSIIRNMNNIGKQFAVMVLGIYRQLKESRTPVDEISVMLQYLGCTPTTNSTRTSTDKDGGTNMFSSSDEICRARDLHRLMECLKQYSSWYNYRLVKQVAEQFTGEEGKKLVAEYETELRKHYINLVAYQCPEFTLDQKIPPGYTKLIVKVEWDYLSTTLQEIEQFQSSLADILGLEPYVFILRSVEEGCVRLEWALPAVVEPHVVRMMAEKENCLRDLKIIKMEILSAEASAEATSVVMKFPSNIKVKPTPFPGSLCHSHTPCGPSLSGSSSIISVLDQPMSYMEAEILSLYDSDSSRGNSMHEDMATTFTTPVSTRIASNGESTNSNNEPYGLYGRNSFHSNKNLENSDCSRSRSASTNSTKCEYLPFSSVGNDNCDLFPAHSSARVLPPSSNPKLSTKYLSYSESDLLNPYHTHISVNQAQSYPSHQLGEPEVTPRRRRRRINFVRSLSKLPKKIARLLYHSDRRPKQDNNKKPLPHQAPPPLRVLRLIDFPEEPRKIGSTFDIAGLEISRPLFKTDDLSISLPNLGEGKSELSLTSRDLVSRPPEASEEEVQRRDSAISTSLSMECPTAGLQLPMTNQHRRDSAVPSSPTSSTTYSEFNIDTRLRNEVVRKQLPQANRDSGVGGSFRSDDSRSLIGPFNQKQIYFDGSDTESLTSVALPNFPTQPSSKRNSYSSHNYVNINPIILEDPDDPNNPEVTCTSHDYPLGQSESYTSKTTSSLKDDDNKLFKNEKTFEDRERSHSLSERSVEGVKRSSKEISSTNTPHSSGYASYAGSTVFSSTMTDEGFVCSGSSTTFSASPLSQSQRRIHHPPPPPGPFASAAIYSSHIKRGGSLKESVRFSTTAKKCNSSPPSKTHCTRYSNN